MSSRRLLVNLFQVMLLVMALVAIALLSAITTMHFAIHGAEVQVPALKGMTVADARSQTAGLGLNLAVDNRYYSSDVAAGHILTQSPPAGTVVRREWKVRVSESLGPQKVEVPDTVNMDERLAALKLRRMGLAIGTMAHLPYARQPDGVVLAQDPPAHAQGIEGPSVNLLLAAPPQDTPDGFVMPDLVGIPVVAAQAALEHVGIKTAPPAYQDVHVPPVGVGNAPPQVPQAPGSVVSQQPAAGSRVDQSTQVKLTVAR
jgi:beta-lactam-binding protein with PASTA domain